MQDWRVGELWIGGNLVHTVFCVLGLAWLGFCLFDFFFFNFQILKNNVNSKSVINQLEVPPLLALISCHILWPFWQEAKLAFSL